MLTVSDCGDYGNYKGHAVKGPSDTVSKQKPAERGLEVEVLIHCTQSRIKASVGSGAVSAVACSQVALFDKYT